MHPECLKLFQIPNGNMKKKICLKKRCFEKKCISKESFLPCLEIFLICNGIKNQFFQTQNFHKQKIQWISNMANIKRKRKVFQCALIFPLMQYLSHKKEHANGSYTQNFCYMCQRIVVQDALSFVSFLMYFLSFSHEKTCN